MTLKVHNKITETNDRSVNSYALPLVNLHAHIYINTRRPHLLIYTAAESVKKNSQEYILRKGHFQNVLALHSSKCVIRCTS